MLQRRNRTTIAKLSFGRPRIWSSSGLTIALPPPNAPERFVRRPFGGSAVASGQAASHAKFENARPGGIGHLPSRSGRLPSASEVDIAWTADADSARGAVERAGGSSRSLLGSGWQGPRPRSGGHVYRHRDQAGRIQPRLHGHGTGQARVERQVSAGGANRSRGVENSLGRRISPASYLLRAAVAG